MITSATPQQKATPWEAYTTYGKEPPCETWLDGQKSNGAGAFKSHDFMASS